MGGAFVWPPVPVFVEKKKDRGCFGLPLETN